MQVDPETRSLVIVTDEDTHKELAKVIQNLDKPKPQVLIKVVFLEVTYNKDSDLGVEGSYTFNLKSPAAAAAAAPPTTTVNGTTVGPTGTTTRQYSHDHYRLHGGCRHYACHYRRLAPARPLPPPQPFPTWAQRSDSPAPSAWPP